MVSFTAGCSSPGWGGGRCYPTEYKYGPHSWYVCSGEDTNALSMPGIEPYFLGRATRSLVTDLSQSASSKIISPRRLHCVAPCGVALRVLQPQIVRSAPLREGGKPLHTSRRQILIAAEQLARRHCQRSGAQPLCFADCRNWI